MPNGNVPGAYQFAKTKLAPFKAQTETDIGIRKGSLEAKENWRKENLILQEILQDIWEESQAEKSKLGWVPFVGSIEDAFRQYEQKKDLKSGAKDPRLKKYEDTAFAGGIKRFSKGLKDLSDRIKPGQSLFLDLAIDWITQGTIKKIGKTLTGGEGFFGKGEWKPFQNLKGDKGLFEGLWSDFGTGKGALADTFKNIGEKGLFKAKPGVTDKMGYSVDPTYGDLSEAIEGTSIFEDTVTYDKKTEENYKGLKNLVKLAALTQKPEDTEFEFDPGSYTTRYGGYR